MKVLVTGSLGYIGCVLMPFLRDRNYQADGIDVGWYATDDNPELAHTTKKDIRDLQLEDLKGYDAIVHLAALSNDPMGELNPDLTEEINYKQTVRLAKLAKKVGVKRFIFASSCSVYGVSKGEEEATEEADLQPLTAYAKSKIKSEIALNELADNSFSPIYLRNGTVYGDSPAIRFDLVLNNLVGSALTTNKIVMLSDGTPWRPLVHVEDVARAILAVLEATKEKIHNQSFNVGSINANCQVKEIAEAVNEVLPSCQVTFGSDSPNPDKRDYRVSFVKIQKFLPEFKPQWTLEKGAKQIVNHFKDIKLTVEDFSGPRYIRLKRLNELIDNKKLNNQLNYIK